MSKVTSVSKVSNASNINSVNSINKTDIVPKLKQDLIFLSSHVNTPIKDVYSDDKIRTALNDVTSTAGVFRNNGNYPEFVKILAEYKPNVVKFGTVGSYLFGCLDVKDVCYLTCIGALPSNPDTMCEKQVWFVDNEGVYKLTDVDSPEAIVYGNEITDKDKQVLSDNGVKTAVLIDSAGKQTNIDLSKYEGHEGHKDSKDDKEVENNKVSSDDDWSFFGLDKKTLMFLVILIIIFIIIFLLLR